MKTLKFIFILFILSLPFTSAFAINDIATLPMFLAIFFFIIYILGVFVHQFDIILKNSLFLFSWFVCILISYFINPTGQKSVNHIVMYFLTVFCLYWGIRNIMIFIVQKDSNFFIVILKYLALIVFISSIYALTEFVCINILGININQYIPREAIKEYFPESYRGFIRARGFNSESGGLAFFLETLAPISVYYVFKSSFNALYKLLYTLILILSLIVTFSSFGYISFIIACVVFLYSYLTQSTKKQNLLLRLFITVCFIFAILIFFNNIVDLFRSVIETKMIGSERYDARLSGIYAGFNYMKGENWLFGFGPASYDTLGTDKYYSFYFTVLMDSGLFGLFFLMLFLITHFFILFRIKNKNLKYCFLISLASATIHYAYMGGYYLPYYWLFLSIMYVYYLQEKSIYKTKLNNK